MLTLTLLRHAKSSWDDPALDDFDRGLAPRGQAAAPLMGAYMARHGIAPEVVLCSSAARTKATLDLVVPFLSPPPTDIRFQRQLYLAPPSRLKAIIERHWGAAEAPKHIMLVGHNPGLHSLALQLVRAGRPADLADLASKLPTGGLVVLTFKARRFSEILEARGMLVHFMTPRRLSAQSPAPEEDD
jgi:phosphohistidine phosphatase